LPLIDAAALPESSVGAITALIDAFGCLHMAAGHCRRGPGMACPAVHTDTTKSLGWSWFLAVCRPLALAWPCSSARVPARRAARAAEGPRALRRGRGQGHREATPRPGRAAGRLAMPMAARSISRRRRVAQ